ncbi:MAG TPA: hypothetical protein VN222_14285 [Novosphingobium sp.]|nr:hypothetical protein [Novosphingobium sp.]
MSLPLHDHGHNTQPAETRATRLPQRIRRSSRARALPVETRLVDRMTVEMHKYPRALRVGILFGSATALWALVAATGRAIIAAF